MPALYSNMVPLGTVAHDFELQGIDDKTYSLNSFAEKEVMVIIFMCNHCPYVKAVIQRLINLQNEFIDRGVQLVGINPNDAQQYLDDSLDNMKMIAKEKVNRAKLLHFEHAKYDWIIRYHIKLTRNENFRAADNVWRSCASRALYAVDQYKEKQQQHDDLPDYSTTTTEHASGRSTSCI